LFLRPEKDVEMDEKKIDWTATTPNKIMASPNKKYDNHDNHLKI